MPSLSSEREQDACEDIVLDAEAALRFTAGMTFADFEADQKTDHAVVRCLEIISEASRRISPDANARPPAFPGATSPTPAISIATPIIGWRWTSSGRPSTTN